MAKTIGLTENDGIKRRTSASNTIEEQTIYTMTRLFALHLIFIALMVNDIFSFPFAAYAFVSRTSTYPTKRSTVLPTDPIVFHTKVQESPSTLLFSHETEIAIYTSAFASSHIGMSAIRQGLIDKIGVIVDRVGLVATGRQLPDFWPGDETGGQEIFPSSEIAGRQLYRILYTIVSFATLGKGFEAYLQSLSEDAVGIIPDYNEVALYYAVATLCGSISIASLINPSPLSLVPVYEAADDRAINGDSISQVVINGNTLRRKDSQKLEAYGLTRITRHPLILPVVPWGLATAMIMGGQTRDFLLFGILSIYAIAGCAAQDMRVLKEEGSVGTVFDPDASLQDFFQQTSFWPLEAIIDSRQSWQTASEEINWWVLAAGIPIAYKIQEAFVGFLQSFAGHA